MLSEVCGAVAVEVVVCCLVIVFRNSVMRPLK